MDTALSRTAKKLQIAQEILCDLHLLERWGAFGTPVLVGAVAYGLVVAPDIDMEIFCDEPKIEDGFKVLEACAQNPHVRSARFANKLDEADMGLYWQLRYLHETGQEWKIDMWSARRDHPGPLSSSLVEPMKQALTDETRQAIVELKEQVLLDATINCGSILLYRAVMDDGIRTLAQFKDWLSCNQSDALTFWTPRKKQG
ncbi:MAG: hypothetical protein ABFD58_07620 [Anaerolineaceae bacterium]